MIQSLITLYINTYVHLYFFFISSLVSVLLCYSFFFSQKNEKIPGHAVGSCYGGGRGMGVVASFTGPPLERPSGGGGGGHYNAVIWCMPEVNVDLLCLFVCLCFDGGKGRAKPPGYGPEFQHEAQAPLITRYIKFA